MYVLVKMDTREVLPFGVFATYQEAAEVVVANGLQGLIDIEDANRTSTIEGFVHMDNWLYDGDMFGADYF